MSKRHKYPKWVVIFVKITTLGIVALYSYEDDELNAIEDVSKRIRPEVADKMDLQGAVKLPRKVRKNLQLALQGKKERAEKEALKVDKTLEQQKDGTFKSK